MKRRNFLAAVAASIAVPVNIDSWNKFLESDKFSEMIYHDATKTWHQIDRLDLTDKTTGRIKNMQFWRYKNTVHVMQEYRMNNGMPAYWPTINMPLENKKFTNREKQDLLNHLIKINKGHSKIFMVQINNGEATNIFGWAE